MNEESNYSNNPELDHGSTANQKRRFSPMVVAGASFLAGVVLTAVIYPLAFAPQNLSTLPEYDENVNLIEAAPETTAPEPAVETAEPTDPESQPKYQARALQSALEAGTESGFPEEMLDQAFDLATTMRGSVVQVFGRTEDYDTGGGTGWLVEPDVIATNDHVVDFEGLDADLIIRTLNGKEMVGEIINTDPDGDIAFVRLPEAIDAPLFRVSRQRVEVGEPVIAVGHPSMVGNWETLAGVVASVDEYFFTDENRKFVDVLTTMPTSTGSSGSAIMRLDGVVVAINSKKDYGTLGINNRAPTEKVFVHTFIPRADNNGGVSSEAIIRYAEESGVNLQLVD